MSDKASPQNTKSKFVPRVPDFLNWSESEIEDLATITQADILDALQDARVNHPDLASIMDAEQANQP